MLKITEQMRQHLKEKAKTKEQKERYEKICIEQFICPDCGYRLSIEVKRKLNKTYFYCNRCRFKEK